MSPPLTTEPTDQRGSSSENFLSDKEDRAILWCKSIKHMTQDAREEGSLAVIFSGVESAAFSASHMGAGWGIWVV